MSVVLNIRYLRNFTDEEMLMLLDTEDPELNADED